MKIEMNEIRDLIDVFNGSGLGEMEIESHGTRVRLKKSGEGSLPETQVSSAVNTADNKVIERSAKKKTEKNETEKGGTLKEEGLVVKAPIAGVFYRASSPGERPFAEEGDTVKKGDVIGLMEAMKLMNEVTAPADGKIIEIIAENAVFCEYNEPIIRMAV